MVSLIIPVHNRSKLLPRLFDSLRRISDCQVEIIFVDNNSDDNTCAIVQNFVDAIDAPGISAILLHETKPGAAAARNCGLDKASGDYVYFFDSDDELSPSMLSAAQELADKEKADAVALQVRYVYPNDHVAPRHIIHSTDPRRHLVANNFATVSLFLRRSFAQKHARWNESLFYWIDFEWAFRIMLANPKTVWLPGVWHKIYVHSDSITGTRYGDRADKIIVAHNAIEQDIRRSENTASRKAQNLLRALNNRRALYAGHIRHEGNKQAAYLIYNSIDCSVLPFIDRLRLPLLYRLSAWGVRGVWRLAL